MKNYEFTNRKKDAAIRLALSFWDGDITKPGLSFCSVIILSMPQNPAKDVYTCNFQFKNNQPQRVYWVYNSPEHAPKQGEFQFSVKSKDGMSYIYKVEF